MFLLDAFLLVTRHRRIQLTDLETLPVVMHVIAEHGCFGLFNLVMGYFMFLVLDEIEHIKFIQVGVYERESLLLW